MLAVCMLCVLCIYTMLFLLFLGAPRITQRRQRWASWSAGQRRGTETPLPGAALGCCGKIWIFPLQERARGAFPSPTAEQDLGAANKAGHVQTRREARAASGECDAPGSTLPGRAARSPSLRAPRARLPLAKSPLRAQPESFPCSGNPGWTALRRGS